MNTPLRNGKAGLKRGRYVGRLGFDPDTEFHTDLAGRRVVTDDGGKTWRYAKKADVSHNSRYQKRVATVDTTANQLLALTLEHGAAAAETLVEQHHFAVQPDDAHYAGVLADPDGVAETVTGHTEAY